MHDVTTTVYQYSELSAAAKEKARDWWIGCLEAMDYADNVIEDASQIARLVGLEFAQKRGDTAIYWSLFSQGSGASFKGRYRPKDGNYARVKDYAPQDEMLHGIAQAFDEAFKLGGEQVSCSITTRGNYSHSGTMEFEFEGADDTITQEAFSEAERLVIGACRNFADWIYRQLEHEYEYQCSEEYVAEVCGSNAYTFTEEGKRFG